jgi:hypothetical protein
MTTKINLNEKFNLFTEHWRPKVVADVNGIEGRQVSNRTCRYTPPASAPTVQRVLNQASLVHTGSTWLRWISVDIRYALES